MKIVKASWEKRNLGIDVYEVEVERHDQGDRIREISKLTDAQYISVKVPVGMISVMEELTSLGYDFIETLQKMSTKQMPPQSKIQARLERSIITREANRQDHKLIENYIEQGMFETDRFSLDSNFTKNQSTNRYKGWIKDVLSNKGSLRCITFKSEVVGFYLVQKKSNSVYFSELAGIFSDVAPLGLGSLINHLAYRYCFDNGAKEVHTSFSLNNIGSAAMHASLPLKLLSQHYVYIKHSTQSSKGHEDD